MMLFPSDRQRHHVQFNLPVVATGVAGLWQLTFGEQPRNFAAAADPATQVAVSALFIVSAMLVITGWWMNRSECPLRQDHGLRIKASGLVGWSVGMMAYLVANWSLWESTSQLFSSPATWVIAALIPSMLSRAWELLRPAGGVRR